MSQDVYSTINPATTSGTQLAALLVSFKNALMSNLKGPTRPPQTTAGGGWIDDSNEGTPGFYWVYKIYTGSIDVEVFRVNLTTGKASISGGADSFEISRISADSVGPILELQKSRIASGGQVQGTDIVGEIQFVGTASDSSNPVVARIKAVATDNMTLSASGTMIVFEATATGSASSVEMMRLLDGKLGVGTTTPSAMIHGKGLIGLMSEKVSDDALGAVAVFQKARLTTPAVQSADVVGLSSFRSTDNVNVATEIAAIEVSAAELHSSTALGSIMKFYGTLLGTLTKVVHIAIANTVEIVTRLDVNTLLFKSANVATSATIPALSASKAIINMTGSTVTSIQGIDAASATQVVVIHNRATVSVTLKNEDAGASAANRLLLPNTQDIEILPNASAELFYSSADARWKVKSGSGSGGGSLRTFATQTVTSGGTITSTASDGSQYRRVKGPSGGDTASVTPFGTSVAWKDGTQIVLVGQDDDDTLAIDFNDANYGAVGNFSEIVLTKYKAVTFTWDASLTRWILTAGGQ